MMKPRYILMILFASAHLQMLAGFCEAAPILQDRLYSVTAVPIMPGGQQNFFATNLNDQGYVTGGVGLGNSVDRGFVWRNGEYHLLDPLPGFESSVAIAINNSNWITGASILCAPERCTDQFALRATLWKPSGTGFAAVDLGLPSIPGEDSVAVGINDRGQISGRSNAIGDVFTTGFLWDEGDITVLSPLPGADVAVPGVINERGQVVGFSRDFSDPAGEDDAMLWENGSGRTLFRGAATSINESGQIVGLTGAFPNVEPVLWENGILTRLQGQQTSFVVDINNSSLAVGVVNDVGFLESRAALWDLSADLFMRLEELIDPALGLSLDRADAINDRGVILARGTGDFNNFYLLTPVEIPEPAMVALLIPGLLAIYWLRRANRFGAALVHRGRRRTDWQVEVGASVLHGEGRGKGGPIPRC
jgi:hypothetical protein